MASECEPRSGGARRAANVSRGLVRRAAMGCSRAIRPAARAHAAHALPTPALRRSLDGQRVVWPARSARVCVCARGGARVCVCVCAVPGGAQGRGVTCFDGVDDLTMARRWIIAERRACRFAAAVIPPVAKCVSGLRCCGAGGCAVPTAVAARA
eukprot:4640186-Prymnesium_polylepis.1